MTEHRVRRLTTGPRPHNEGLDAGVGEGWRRSRNLLLSLILHSPGLLIQGKALNHDCVPSVEPAKKNPSPEIESQGAAPPPDFQTSTDTEITYQVSLCALHWHSDAVVI